MNEFLLVCSGAVLGLGILAGNAARQAHRHETATNHTAPTDTGAPASAHDDFTYRYGHADGEDPYFGIRVSCNSCPAAEIRPTLAAAKGWATFHQAATRDAARTASR